MAEPGRFSLLGIIGGLMVAAHLGDVADEINYLCDLAGVPRPDGNYLDGWTADDWRNINHFPRGRRGRRGCRTRLGRHGPTLMSARAASRNWEIRPSIASSRRDQASCASLSLEASGIMNCGALKMRRAAVAASRTSAAARSSIRPDSCRRASNRDPNSARVRPLSTPAARSSKYSSMTRSRQLAAV